MKRVDGILQREEQREWISSKGNQNKWFDEGIWYKEDSLGYESLAEVLVSSLLKKSNAGAFVTYEYEEIENGGIRHQGCRAKDFLEPEDDKLISVERLFQAFFTIRDVEDILAGFRGIYEEAVLERICEVMRIQLQKYSYFW